MISTSPPLGPVVADRVGQFFSPCRITPLALSSGKQSGITVGRIDTTHAVTATSTARLSADSSTTLRKLRSCACC